MLKRTLPLLIGILLCHHFTSAQINLNLGLKAYYPFSGNANDASGNNNNPVFNNATLTSDRLGNPNSAYHFNGTSNYMQIPNSPSLNSANTLSLFAWVRPTGFYAGDCHGNSVIMKADADYLPGTYEMRFDDNAYTSGGNCGGTPVDQLHQNFYGIAAGSPPPGYTPYITVNQWHSVALTYDGTTAKLFVDCELKYSASQGAISFTNSFDLFFGKLNAPSFPYWFNGDLDEVRIYNRALTTDEVYALGSCSNTLGCNNWLYLSSNPQTVTVGDLDVAGNQLTVEAVYNRPSSIVVPGNTFGKIVSKHSGPSDVNYSLMAYTGEITTTNGYVNTPPICTPQFDKTYHVAMVYDGTSLKFYQNGHLMSSVPWTGNLVNNNLPTTIGNGAALPGSAYEQFGYINEVRIWNVARTQAQLQAYMNSNLPSPTTQTGLLGYYSFDNLLNKQGNTLYDGTANSGATINATNPNCTLLPDSCPVISNIGAVINAYTPVLAQDICLNKITVEDASAFNAGDTVVMMQMKGAVIDSSNTAAFGSITNYRNAGNYEFNYVKSKSGNVIELKNTIIRQYDIPDGKVQLIRVPYYDIANITNTLTCPAWDGSKGGVLVLNAKNKVTLNANIDVTGKGFTGGKSPNSNNLSWSCSSVNYYYPAGSKEAAAKGEGIAVISTDRTYGRGRLANAGGGGDQANTGGGGGAGVGSGGFGGNQLSSCPSVENRGVGGTGFNLSAQNKVIMGGGGGSGEANNPPPLNFAANGGNGGGIIIITAQDIESIGGAKIIANGDPGLECVTSTGNCHEGMGGGGGAGSILLNINNYLSGISIESNGGKGANASHTSLNSTFLHGPGGGGGGGLIWFKQVTMPASATTSLNGGVNGVNINFSNNAWGATSGQNGNISFTLAIPVANTPFKKNIDSVRMQASLVLCRTWDFKGFGYTNTSAITTWLWSFGDGGTASTQNATHTYTAPGTYTVKLTGTDINGCKDSISQTITIPAFIVDAGNDVSLCSNPGVTTLHASAGASYAWTPAVYLNNATIQNPVATISSTTKFFVTITSPEGCVGTDSVLVTLNSAPAGIRYPTISAYPMQAVQLQARNLGGTSYVWTPTTGLNNPLISNPVYTSMTSQEFTVLLTTAQGCPVVDTVLVKIEGNKGIWVPKGFTPNHDGVNDRLYPIVIGYKQMNYFRIYNRWGNLLFETNNWDPAYGWDGIFKKQLQPSETYTWAIEVMDFDGSLVRKSGNTFLIR